MILYCNCDMDVSEGKAESATLGAKNIVEMKSDDKLVSKGDAKADGKHASHMDDKKIDDDITAVFEKG